MGHDKYVRDVARCHDCAHTAPTLVADARNIAMPMSLNLVGPAGLTRGSAQIHTYRRGISIRARVQLSTSQRSGQAGQVRDLHPWKRNLATILATQIRAAQVSGISRSVEWETGDVRYDTANASPIISGSRILDFPRKAAARDDWPVVMHLGRGISMRTWQLPGSVAPR